mgnify:CR=1 FL=1
MVVELDWLEVTAPDGGILKVQKRPHPRARRLRLTVSAEGARLSYPHGTHPGQMAAFLQQNAAWLARKLDELKPTPTAPLCVGQSRQILLRGVPVSLDWLQDRYPRVQHTAQGVRITLPERIHQPERLAQALLRSWYETELRHDMLQAMPRLVTQLDKAPSRLRVRPLKSLWGSLDSRDGIGLDLTLILAPPAVARYVLAHELAHLRVRNHSQRFWAQVGELVPDYEVRRAWLREHGTPLKTYWGYLFAKR